MKLNITSDPEKNQKDIIFQKYKNELINFDKIKKNYLISLNKFNISEDKKIQNINQASIDNINTSKTNKTLLSNHSNNNTNPLNLKKIKLHRIIKENKNKIKKPKFNSQLSSLKYYLLYSEPGVGKKSLQNIYEDLDKIQKKIDNFEENEKNKMNDYEKRNKNNEKLIENKMVINIPDYSNKKENIDNFLRLCGTYEKYNYEFSKIKNLFGTKINLFEKRDIIKNYMDNMRISNKTTSNFSCPKKKLKLFFPKIDNKSINKTINKYKKINTNKSFNKNKIKIKSNSNRNIRLVFKGLNEISNKIKK